VSWASARRWLMTFLALTMSAELSHA
jgi:hypothetical protein